MKKKTICRSTTSFIRSYTSKLLLFTGLFFLIQTSSCKKIALTDPSLIGSGDTLNAIRVDSFVLETKTVDDVALSAVNAPNVIIGKMDDPIFGQTIGSVYAPFTINDNNLDFEGVQFDSIVLQLKFTSTYGPMNLPMHFKVYEMQESISSSGSYLNESHFAISTPEIGSRSLNPEYGSIHDIQGDTLTSVIRIRLSDLLGERIFDADSAQLVNSSSFETLFKGLYITCDPVLAGDGVVYINPAADENGLILYYDDTSSYTLKKSSSTRWVSHYDHFQNGYPIQEAKEQSGINDSIVYVQSMIGSRVQVKVRHLENLPDMIVNKAELVISEISALTDSSYPAASALYLYRIAEDGSSVRIGDDLIDGISHFDGNYRSYEGSSVAEYRINVSRYVQGIVNGDFPNEGLYLHTRPFFSIADRVILAGGSHSKYRMRLILHYTAI